MYFFVHQQLWISMNGLPIFVCHFLILISMRLYNKAIKILLKHYSDNFSKIISINLLIIFFFRMSWWHTHLLEFPTGHRATPTSTWPSATWCGAPSCCARPRSATRWTTSWPPTSRSCSPTWTSRSHWGSSENYVQ